MVEIVKGFPDCVIGFIATGRLTRKDYLDTVIPAVDGAFKQHPRAPLCYELGPQKEGIDFGGDWEDLKLGVEHFSHGSTLR
jgi:hypothetical protein